MKLPEVIAAHTNTDFDAFAAMLAACRLYPRARICLTGALNRNVKEFCAVYGDRLPIVEAGAVELEHVRRLIAIETLEPNRLGELGHLLEREDVEIVSFDHHGDGGQAAGGRTVHRVTSEDGALTTLMLRILAERGLPVTPLEATVYALGIHEDTGSLTFSTTTERDAEALAFCMRHGASPALIERFLHSPLSGAQRDLLARALSAAEEVPAGQATAMVAALRSSEYVEEVAVVAHRYLDVTGAQAFVLLVEMEERVFVIARSRGGSLDVDAALSAVGGGGHAAAASAVLRDLSLEAARDAVVEGLRAAGRRSRRARDLVRGPAEWVEQEASVDDALLLCRRRGLAGVAIGAEGRLIGVVAEADLRRALGHLLGHAPVKAVMSSGVPTVEETAGMARVAEALAASPIGSVVVVREEAGRLPPLTEVVGVVRRRDLVDFWGGVPAVAPQPQLPNLASRIGDLGLDDLLGHIQAVATAYAGVYLVGGAVRDLLLQERVFDIDIAVEGDGIAYAEELARRLGGHVRAHPKFRTAVVVAAGEDGGEGLRVDVASTRSEFYEAPAALPTVERATLRADLTRRDFTMNAMAVSLRSEDLGTLHDYFGGLQDLAEGRVVVLHNLSFIEDPTRIFRALRYETRYGLRMDTHTYNLARACSEMDLVGDLTSARLRDELVLLLRESPIDPALRRMQQLGLSRSVHPRCTTGPTTRTLLREAEARWRRYGLASEVPLWRLRLVWLLRNLTPEEVGAWVERMRFRRADGIVLERSMVVGRRLRERLEHGMNEADLREAACGEPLEALIVAMVLGEGGVVERRLAEYLARTRHVRLEISGRDLLDLGFPRSPGIGRALRTLLRLKVNGVIAGREQELEAARRLRRAAGARGGG